MVKSYLSLAYLGRFSTCSSVVYVQYTPSSQIERRDKTNRKTANYNRRQSFFSKVCLLFGFFSYLLFVVNEEKKSPLK